MRWPAHLRRKWNPGWIVSGGGGSGAALQVGPIASLPSTPTAPGARYKCTDSPYEFIGISGAWQPFIYGYQVTQPVLANFTQANVDHSTFDTTHGGILWTVPNGGSANDLQFIGLPIPGSGAYYVDCAVLALNVLTQGSFGVGITGGLTPASRIAWGGFGYANGTSMWTYQVTLFTNTTTFNSAAANSGAVTFGPLLWFRVYDDLTNLNWRLSMDGYNYFNVFSGARAGFLTPTDAAFVVNAFNSAMQLHLVHWSIHT